MEATIGSGKPKSKKKKLTIQIRKPTKKQSCGVAPPGPTPYAPDTVLARVSNSRAESATVESRTLQHSLQLSPMDHQKDGTSIAALKSIVDAPQGTSKPKTAAKVKEANASCKNEGIHAHYAQITHDSLMSLDGAVELLKAPENDKFCSESRRNEWFKEIADLKDKRFPETVIGCLGASGAGKSSLLNALLNESEILPTSCSRGCTAAVVELRFHHGFHNTAADTTTVYRGEVELMSLQEWLSELEMLLGSCCAATDENANQKQPYVYDRKPEESEAAAAWGKINEVYGRGTMESFANKSKTEAWDRLSHDARIVSLLQSHCGAHANTIVVEEGTVDATKAKSLLEQLPNLKGKLKTEKKKWAKGFRKKINDYVYRKGNGKEPQTWPLIKKVSLYGPWSVLSTGAVLVDLPGVRDSNATRAKVAETYIDKCDKIWVVAPIKRAVDDKTAKELMGEHFKRRLLMDGKYGIVSFICTHSDDCVIAEVMRDHEDVARNVPGRWEEMEGLQNQIDLVEKQLSDLNEEGERLNEQSDEVEEEIRELTDDDDDASTGEDGGNKAQELHELSSKLKQTKESIQAVDGKAKDLEGELRARQRSLKVIAAKVRNDYSIKCLKTDYRAGWEELCRKPADEELDDTVAPNAKDNGTEPPPLPDDYQLDVHCISSNDYLAITTRSGPITFSNTVDTNIPSLCDSVHATTASFKADFVRNQALAVSDILHRVKLYASQDGGGEEAVENQYRLAFQNATASIEHNLKSVVDSFVHGVEKEVDKTLQPALTSGALKGFSSAMTTVCSWSETPCRTKDYRGPEQNALKYPTLVATLRRDGVFISASAGMINLIQELCDPVEKEYFQEWRRIMDTKIVELLNQAHGRIVKLCRADVLALGKQLVDAGMESARSVELAGAGKRGCELALRAQFREIKKLQMDTQRKLSRQFQKNVAEEMKRGFEEALAVPGGKGYNNRMRKVLKDFAAQVSPTLFNNGIGDLLDGVQQLVQKHEAAITGLARHISHSLEQVYSVSWSDGDSPGSSNQPRKKETLECRRRLLAELSGLCESHRGTMSLVGIQTESPDHDVVAVNSWEDMYAKKERIAKDTGNFVDLLSSEDEEEEPRRHRKKPKIAHPPGLLSQQFSQQRWQMLPDNIPSAASLPS